jgi:arginine repressor
MVEYEWDCEKVDREEGDIVDHFFGESLEEVLGWVEADDDQHEYRIVLERVCGMNRSWAYVIDDGTLPEYFADSAGNDTTKVPQRFHREAKTMRSARTTGGK